MTLSRQEVKMESSEMNGHLPNEKKQKDNSKHIQPKKVYHMRNSILTDLMEVNHLQSVYNISVAVCFLLLLNAIIFYLAAPEKLWEDVRIVRWGMEKLHYFAVIWLMFHLFAYTIFRGFKLWISIRNMISAKVADGCFILLYIGAIIFMFASSTFATLHFKLPPITGFATMCEQVRIFMKIYSFVRENVPRVLMYKAKQDGEQHHNLCPSVKHYFYYLFAPTLIYRDSYPRELLKQSSDYTEILSDQLQKSERIHWKNVFINLFKFASVIFITYCAFMRFNVDMFVQVGLRQFTKKEAALITAGSMVVGSLMMFLMFYGILHCWLNFFGELVRFGDRQFYQDWWNSTSFAQYYRRWNSVVHDWLHAYIYQESHRFGFSRAVSTILVFFVSALVHEYIICLSLGFFYPVLCVVYSTIGVSLVFFTKEKTSQFWNTFMWGMLFSGWGVVICCYSTEWFARINCPKQETTADFFIPRSWDPSCRILNFS